ncbi:MAG TPA: helix-turn-helix domain-containing protein [Xanthobacteraceae bacterium]|nr:helix-turn-helix domain-containing protein [Xanthobacteraceae bacterium]
MTQALRDDQPEATQLPADLPSSTVSEIASWLVGQPLDAVERELIRHTLENCGGDRALTASLLGISLPTLRKKIRAYSVRGEALPDSFEPAREIPQAANDGAPDVQESAAEESALEARNENLSGPQASGPTAELMMSEPEPTLAVPEPDNDPRLTLVEVEAAPAPVAVQGETEISEAPTPEFVTTGPEPVVEATPVEPVETPKLIAGIAAPRAKQKRNVTGPVVAGTFGLLIAAPIAYGLVSTQEKSTAIDVDRNRLEVTAIESPRFEQRIQAPVWVAPARAAQAMPVDIAADRRSPQVAPAPAPVTVAASQPAAPVPLAAAETPIVPAPVQTVADFNPELGTQMELGPVDIAADVAMDLGPVNRLADLRMELSPADIAADTRMDAGPVNIVADVRMEFVDAPETTGSIPLPTFFAAPKNVPSPLMREGPGAPVRRAAPRPARAPAQAEVPPPAETFPLIFPFSLFAPKNAQTGAAAVTTPQPLDCCIR